MELDEYKRNFNIFTLSCHQSRVVALLAADNLRDFPSHLSEATLTKLTHSMVELGKAVLTVASHAFGIQRENESTGSGETQTISDIDPFTLHALSTFIVAFQAGGFGETKHLDFTGLVYGQELVSLLAYLDAFIVDSLQAMCQREPRLLRSSKTITWEQVVDLGGWDQLTAAMIDDFCYESGWKPIRERLARLRKEHGVCVSLPTEILDFISNAEQLRHVVVHNGGRVSREYLRKTDRHDVTIGDVLPITGDYTLQVNNAVFRVGSALFIAIATKFFDATEHDMNGVFRYREKDRP